MERDRSVFAQSICSFEVYGPIPSDPRRYLVRRAGDRVPTGSQEIDALQWGVEAVFSSVNDILVPRWGRF